MNQRLSYENVVDILLERFPELLPLMEEHIQLHDEVLPHVFFGELTRYLMGQVRAGRSEPDRTTSQSLARILDFLEQAMISSDEKLQELVSVSFLENLDGSDEAYSKLRNLLGPNLRRELAGYEMPTTIKPLTKKQLVEYFKDYREAFPDWVVEHDVVLVRSQGPIKQHMAFEALRDGAYRPSSNVEVLIAGGASILDRFLDIKHIEVFPRQHAAKWPQIVKAMEEQFLPPVRQPLNVVEVLRLGEEEVARDRIDNIDYSTGLAAVNAYVDDVGRAIFWCDRVAEQLKARGRQSADWEKRQAQFTGRLCEAIRLGQHQTFLRACTKR